MTRKHSIRIRGPQIATVGLITAILLTLYPAAPTQAAVAGYPQGGTTQVLTFFRKPFVCYSKGLPVLFTFNYFLNDLATTNFFRTPTVITINPDYIDRLARINPGAALFVVGHECGHARLLTLNEADADCWAASAGIAQRWFVVADLPAIKKLLFADVRGNWTHPPGEERAEHIEQCVRAALSGAPLVPI